LTITADTNDEPNSPKKPRGSLTIKTDVNDNPGTATPEVSPEIRAFRRMGASHVDLSNWAEQLKSMEESRDARNQARDGSQQGHPAFTSERDSEKEKERDFSNESWMCKGAAQHEREAEMEAPMEVPKTRQAMEMSGYGLPLEEGKGGSKSARSSVYIDNTTLTPSSRVSRSRQPSRSTSLSPHRLRPSFSKTTPAPSFTLATPPPAPPGYRYAPASTSTPVPKGSANLHDKVRRKQHVRSRSSIARASGDEEDEWASELRRMESRERVRQLGGSVQGSEDEDGDIGVAR
jgi:hypothetical protein